MFAKRRSDRWELVRAGQAEKKQPKKLSVCTIVWNRVGVTVEKDHQAFHSFNAFEGGEMENSHNNGEMFPS